MYRKKSDIKKINNTRVITPFDPEPAAKLVKEIMDQLSINYAVIGRIAVWAYLSAEEQEFTKGLDIAVPAELIAEIELQIKLRKLNYTPLTIGGINVHEENISIDFIDRRQYHGELFRQAIKEAGIIGDKIQIGAIKLPLIPIEYLIALKLVSGEPKDDGDVKRLLKDAEFDYNKSKEIVMKFLGPATADRLDVFAREAGRPEVPPKKRYKDS
jgi:hypothetical protein